MLTYQTFGVNIFSSYCEMFGIAGYQVCQQLGQQCCQLHTYERLSWSHLHFLSAATCEVKILWEESTPKVSLTSYVPESWPRLFMLLPEALNHSFDLSQLAKRFELKMTSEGFDLDLDLGQPQEYQISEPASLDMSSSSPQPFTKFKHPPTQNHLFLGKVNTFWFCVKLSLHCIVLEFADSKVQALNCILWQIKCHFLRMPGKCRKT